MRGSREHNLGEWLRRESVRKAAGGVVTHLVLLLGAFVILLPFFWMVSTALKVPGQEFIYPPEWIPSPIRWQNFVEGWTTLPFTQWMFNSLTVTALAVTGAVVSSSVVAYGFSRFRFPGRNVLFVLLLSTMMLPFHVRLIPTFVVYRALGWIDTFLPLIVPYFLAGVPLFVFLVRQFMMTIPLELDDAAWIDGCGVVRIFLLVTLPMAKPVLGIVGVFCFLRSWNALLEPLIYLTSLDRFTLAIGLRFFQDEQFVEWNLLMAVSLLVLLPCIVLFFIAQRHYIQSVVTTGVKG